MRHWALIDDRFNSETGPTQIKAAYYTLTKSCHPDTVGDDPRASEKFRMITEAYDCVYSLVSKRDYDRSRWENQTNKHCDKM